MAHLTREEMLRSGDVAPEFKQVNNAPHSLYQVKHIMLHLYFHLCLLS